MSEFFQIQWTSGSLDEARRVSRYLVQERYVACAEIIPWVESVSMLNNQLETNQETKIMFVTRRELIETVTEIILKNCKFQIPEILLFSIVDANSTYKKWLMESTVPLASHQ